MYLFNWILSAVLYVLQAVGLYTLAQRRGIRYAWLAWVPVGSLWVLASLADDYQARVRGKQRKMRLWLPLAYGLTLVLLAVTLVGMYQMVQPLLEVIPLEDWVAYYDSQLATDSVDHMFDSVQEQTAADFEARLEAAISEEMSDQALSDALCMVLGILVLSMVAIAVAVLEYWCLFDLYASCNPATKLLYLILTVLFGVQAVIIFFSRKQDLGMIPPNPTLPGGFDTNQPRWNY